MMWDGCSWSARVLSSLLVATAFAAETMASGVMRSRQIDLSSQGSALYSTHLYKSRVSIRLKIVLASSSSWKQVRSCVRIVITAAYWCRCHLNAGLDVIGQIDVSLWIFDKPRDLHVRLSSEKGVDYHMLNGLGCKKLSESNYRSMKSSYLFYDCIYACAG